MNQELAMNSTGGTMRLGKVMEIVIWIAGPAGVYCECSPEALRIFTK